MQLKVWRIENLRIDGPKSRSGASKIEVRRFQNRGLEDFLAALGATGRSWDHPEGVVVRLGGVLEPSWRRFGCVLDGLEAVFGASWSRLGGILGEIGRENGAKLASKLNKLKILCLISAKAQNYDFSNRF